MPLLILLFLLQTPRWELISSATTPEAKPVQFFFDTESIKRNDDVISTTLKISFPDGPGNGFEGTVLSGLPVYTIIASAKFDCAKNTIKSDASKTFILDNNGNLLKPKRKLNEVVGQPSQDKGAHYLWEYVCERASLPTTTPPKLKTSP